MATKTTTRFFKKEYVFQDEQHCCNVGQKWNFCVAVARSHAVDTHAPRVEGSGAHEYNMYTYKY